MLPKVNRAMGGAEAIVVTIEEDVDDVMTATSVEAEKVTKEPSARADPKEGPTIRARPAMTGAAEAETTAATAIAVIAMEEIETDVIVTVATRNRAVVTETTRATNAAKRIVTAGGGEVAMIAMIAMIVTTATTETTVGIGTHGVIAGADVAMMILAIARIRGREIVVGDVPAAMVMMKCARVRMNSVRPTSRNSMQRR
jgi:hypothetical protein